MQEFHLSKIDKHTFKPVMVSPVADTANKSSKSLGERIAEKHRLSPPAVVEWLFYASIDPWKRPLVRVIRNLKPTAFAHDLQAVKDAAAANRLALIYEAVNLLQRVPEVERTFVRESLGCRVSGRRLLDVATEYFATD